jgi:Putative zinc-finger
MSEDRKGLVCPREVLDWIPWYAEDALAETQRGAVEAHAAQCADCRVELAMVSGGATPSAAVPDSEPVFARVLARIEAQGVADAPVRVGSHLAPASARRTPLLHRTHRSGRRAPWRIAATAALLLGVGAAGWFANSAFATHADASYKTASEPGTPALVNGSAIQLDVVFRGDADVDLINTDLRALGAVVTSGPSPAGRYRVALPEGSDASAAIAMLRAEGRGIASFAEPLRP